MLKQSDSKVNAHGNLTDTHCNRIAHSRYCCHLKIHLPDRSGYEQDPKRRSLRYLEVVGEKSEATYGEILGRYSLNPTKFLMVGNSLRSDVLPVVRIGGRGVYIPSDQTWFHEHVSQGDVAGLEFVELERLDQLPDYLARLT